MAFARLGAMGRGFGRVGAGGKVSAAPAGGALLLVGETSGFAADFTYATNAQRVAVKTAGAVVYSGTSFFTSSGTSSKWVYDVVGTLVNVAVGTLPLEYDPTTHAAKGLLCEPAATNLAKQSAGLLGTISPWDSSGGATYTTSAQTDPAGGLAAIQVAVTSNTGNNYAQNISSLTNGVAYTASMWVKGTASQQIYFSANSSQNGAHNQLVTFTGAWQRVSSTVTVNATNAYLAFECYNRASPGSSLPNVTFHVWGAQFETGAVATSYIPTLAATVTRAGDDPNVVTSAFPAVLPVNSMFADVTMLSDVGAVLAINNGSHAESMGFYYQIVWSYYVRTGSAYQANLSPAPTTAVAKLAARAAANDFALCMNGGAVDTDTAGAMPTAAANRLHLSGVGGPIGPGGFYLRSIVIVPRLWSNAELIAKTA